MIKTDFGHRPRHEPPRVTKRAAGVADAFSVAAITILSQHQTCARSDDCDASATMGFRSAAVVTLAPSDHSKLTTTCLPCRAAKHTDWRNGSVVFDWQVQDAVVIPDISVTFVEAVMLKVNS